MPVGVKVGIGVHVGVGKGIGCSKSETISATKTEYVMKANTPTRIHCQRAIGSPPFSKVVRNYCTILSGQCKGYMLSLPLHKSGISDQRQTEAKTLPWPGMLSAHMDPA